MKEKMKIKSSVIMLVTAFSLSGCGPSSEQLATATDACQGFVQERMSVTKENTRIFDSWEKDGKIVVDVGYKQRSYDSSYSMRLCVYDDKEGTITLPSVLNENDWRK